MDEWKRESNYKKEINLPLLNGLAMKLCDMT